MNKEDVIKKVGQRIRGFREGRDMTITDLADKLDIEYNNLIRIEKGRTNPTLGTLFKICQALGITLSRLVDIGEQSNGGGENPLQDVQQFFEGR